MKKPSSLFFIKFTAAFCSIAYELILAQTLVVFLSNTVLRYCVTIGLYMFCMGLGAFFVERRLARDPALMFWRTEIALTVLGAGAVPVLFFVEAGPQGTVAFLVAAHVLICLIGFLTGLELPLSLELARRAGRPRRNSLLAVDYLGAFLGTVAFALVFYPWAGLIAAAWSASLLNALAAFVLARSWIEEGGQSRWPVLISVLLFLLTTIGLLTSAAQERFLIGIYLR